MADNTLNIQNQQEADNETNDQFLSFYLDEEEYAVEILLVQEIVRNFKPSKVPNANNIIQGMVNFRGKVIPLMDIRAKLGLPTRENDNLTVSIVVESKGKNIGMTVDQVYDIVSLSEKNIQVVGDSSHDLKAEHLKGMGKTGDRLILLLDLDKVLSFEDAKGR